MLVILVYIVVDGSPSGYGGGGFRYPVSFQDCIVALGKACNAINGNRTERRNSRFSSLRREPSELSPPQSYALVARAQSCANHLQHIGRLSRETFRVPRGTKGQISYQV